MKQHWTLSEKEIPLVAGKIAHLLNGKNFVLWLYGEMGAGKTTWTRHFLRALGLPIEVTVSSPTFSYLNDYEIQGEWYAHMDLYRMVPGGLISPESMGLTDQRDYKGYILEWPDRWPELKPTAILKIQYGETLDSRIYEFEELC